MVIKNLRLENNWSQEHLANLASLSTRTIQRIEKDDTGSLDSLKVLAKVFEISIEELQKKLCDKNVKIADKKIKYNFFDYKTIRFIAINLLLILINLFTNPHNLWFVYVLIGWGFFFGLKKYKNYMKYKESL